jgi:cytochrome c biogenesis protein CcdA
VIQGEFAYAFGLGLLAAFNPCGFAMLPAYLAFFLEVDNTESSTFDSVVRALKVGSVMTAGFVMVFTAAWLVIDFAWSGFQDHLSWATMVIGLLMVGLGAVYALGKEVNLHLPHFERGGETRELRSMFLFGISYAVASLSCTIPLFMAAVAGTFDDESFVSGLASLAMYGIGMGVVITFLTVCLATARQGVVRHMRKVLPYVGRIAGVLLMIAGAYMAWYGWWEEQTLANNDVAEGPVGLVTGWSYDVYDWINDVGAVRLGLALTGLTAMVLVLAWGFRASRPTGGRPTAAGSEPSEPVAP